MSTQGALAGAATPPYCVSPSSLLPKLPAAATTTMPASTARRAARVSGSDSYDSSTGAPIDRLITRTPNRLRPAMTKSMARMTSLT